MMCINTYSLIERECVEYPSYTLSVPISVSSFSWCPHDCIFENSEGHNGPDRVRNTNLSVLDSETMWSQPILIEHLDVLLLLQTHIHFPSCTKENTEQ